jgi:GAF domain-containing protein
MGQLIQGGEKEIANRFPGLSFSLKMGLRSMLSVPLISKDRVIAVLHVRSTRPNEYTERDVELAERVGHQIAGAIENAKLFTERIQVEEALRRSEEEAKLAQVRKTLKMSVDELELSVRSHNCLRSANIKTIADLVRKDESELLSSGISVASLSLSCLPSWKNSD